MADNWLSSGNIGGTAFEPKDGAASLPMGRLKAKRASQESQPLNYYGRAHLFCVAPSGAGKSQALAIPSLLSWPHSVIVLDVKGELYFHTAGYRHDAAKGLNHSVYRFDPTDRQSHVFNPLRFINRDPFLIEQSIADIAEVIVPIPAQTREPFFLRAARQVIETALHYLCGNSPEAISMSEFTSLCFDAVQFRDALTKITNAPRGTFLDSTRNIAAALNQQFFESDGGLTKTGQSVWAELSNQLAPLNNQQVRAVTQGPAERSWKPRDLRHGKTSVYITLPPSAKSRYRAILALVLNAHLAQLLDRLPDGKDKPILLLLDEMPQLGHMRAIEQVIDLGRAYGLLLYGFAQRRSQIKESYGDPGDFLGTFEARAYMNPSPEDGSAELLSKAIGETERAGRAGIATERVPVAPIGELCGHEYRDDIIILSRGARPARVEKGFIYDETHPLHHRLGWEAPARRHYESAAARGEDKTGV